ncbi:MAG: hypothetical protein E7541_07860 [Ruminococcaceae bacterium]|nr:hypothetical protein [Oscillospiraceae bacterium]
MIPEVQHMTPGQGSLSLPFALTLTAAEWAEKAARCASLLLDATVTPGENGQIRAVRAPLPAEGYRLTVADTVTVAYADYQGLCHGLATLSGLLSVTDGGYTCPRCTVEDAPVATHRGTMLDVARGIQPLEELLEDMVLLARARMNVLHLHLFDSIGCAVALSCLPEDLLLKEHYTRQDVDAIVAQADVLGLELIPEFDLPGHSHRMTKVLPALSCPVEEANTGWVTCVGTEETFRLYDAIIREMDDWFPGGRYFHVGGDELHMEDVADGRYLCHWETCPRCRQRMAQEGLRDRQELYYYVMQRVYQTVTSLGRQMVMWSDQIDCARPCPLPRDILLHFWRVAGQGRGPVEGCSFAAQAAMGFEMINSHYLEAYIEEEVELSADTIRDWRWDTRPGCAEEHRSQVRGGELCVWTYGPNAEPGKDRHDYDYINRVLPSAVMLMGDTLWSGREFTYDEAFRQALTRAILGPRTPVGLDIFAAIGSVVPPKWNAAYAYHDKVTLTPEAIRQLAQAVEQMPSSPRTARYAATLHQIAKERENT